MSADIRDEGLRTRAPDENRKPATFGPQVEGEAPPGARPARGEPGRRPSGRHTGASWRRAGEQSSVRAAGRQRAPVFENRTGELQKSVWCVFGRLLWASARARTARPGNPLIREERGGKPGHPAAGDGSGRCPPTQAGRALRKTLSSLEAGIQGRSARARDLGHGGRDMARCVDIRCLRVSDGDRSRDTPASSQEVWGTRGTLRGRASVETRPREIGAAPDGSVASAARTGEHAVGHVARAASHDGESQRRLLRQPWMGKRGAENSPR